MLSQIIYKRDNTGAIREWRYEVDEAAGAYRSHSNVEGGTVVLSGWTTCVPKSQSNKAAQAHFEAKSEMGKKLDKDYVARREDVDAKRDAGPMVMLAKEYGGTLKAGVEHDSQPKLDGIRCKVNRFGMWSRTNKPILGAPHILALLMPAFRDKPDLVFDGELYNHELKDNFNEIVSMVRKSKPTDEDIEKAAGLVEYHLYDIIVDGKTFRERDRMLDLFVSSLGAKEIVKVPTTPVSSTQEVDAAYGSYLEAGYEGQIIRLDAPYENKRSKNLLKRKDFLTREFKLLAIEDGNGNWAGIPKRITFELEDGRPCGGGIRGSREQAAALRARAESLIGKPVTVRYFTPTPDGMPRFPVAIDFDRFDHVADS